MKPSEECSQVDYSHSVSLCLLLLRALLIKGVSIKENGYIMDAPYDHGSTNVALLSYNTVGLRMDS